VGSNGSLVEVRDNGNGTLTYHWAERYPIATYLVSLAVADYVVLTDWFHYSPTDSMVILNYVLPTSLVSAIQPLGFVPSMLQFFSDRYGLYPFIREKYGHAQFGWGGAMEHQTMTSTSNFTESTLAHELAHHWFGDMITCANWPSLWLNEGFATYSEALWQEWRHGEAVYRADMRDMMPNAKVATGTLYVQDTSTVAKLFAFDRVYAKGAWVLQMLRHVLGDSTFFRTMRAYANDPRFRFKAMLKVTAGCSSAIAECAVPVPKNTYWLGSSGPSTIVATSRR
jgi:Aminopeptidase N